jgi:hypothetical protein
MKLTIALASLALTAITPASCWAWGATGHEWISGIAVEKLPDSVPSFVRTPEAAAEIAVLGRELDRSKGAGKTHDAERDPGIASTWATTERSWVSCRWPSCHQHERHMTPSCAPRASRPNFLSDRLRFFHATGHPSHDREPALDPSCCVLGVPSALL